MTTPSAKPSRVAAVVTQVLPATGLAYLSGHDGSSWAVTRATTGAGLDALEPGQRVALTIEHHADFDVVSEYGALQD